MLERSAGHATRRHVSLATRPLVEEKAVRILSRQPTSTSRSFGIARRSSSHDERVSLALSNRSRTRRGTPARGASSMTTSSRETTYRAESDPSRSRMCAVVSSARRCRVRARAVSTPETSARRPFASAPIDRSDDARMNGSGRARETRDKTVRGKVDKKFTTRKEWGQPDVRLS